jgi:hypothetical protein
MRTEKQILQTDSENSIVMEQQLTRKRQKVRLSYSFCGKRFISPSFHPFRQLNSAAFSRRARRREAPSGGA